MYQWHLQRPVTDNAIALLGVYCTLYLPNYSLFMCINNFVGWNDVGFHNPDIISPNIDYLASHGMILNQSYVQPVCSP